MQTRRPPPTRRKNAFERGDSELQSSSAKICRTPLLPDLLTGGENGVIWPGQVLRNRAGGKYGASQRLYRGEYMRARTTIAALACLLLGAWGVPIKTGESQELLSRSLVIRVLDAGDGEAVWLTTPDPSPDLRANVLIDCGPPGFGGKIVALMQALGIQRIDSLLLSSVGDERIGGCPDILRQMQVQEVRATRQRVESPAMARLDAALQPWLVIQGQPNFWELAEGQVLPWARYVQGVVLNPRSTATTLDQYDDSLVLEINYGNWGVLLTGDVRAAGRQHVLEAMDSYLAWHPVQVLKVADHGSAFGTSPTFLATAFGGRERMSSRIAILTNGSFDWSSRPDPQVVRWLGEAGAEVVGTAQHGTITLVIDPVSGPQYLPEH